MAESRSLGRELAPLVLRLALGAIFVMHGAQKLGLFDPAPSWATTQAAVHNFSTHLAEVNLEPALAIAWATALIEFLGGVFCALGIVTRVAAAAIGIVMSVAVWKIHFAKGFFSGHGGYEYQFLILAVAFALVLIGGGAFALDSLLVSKRKNEKKI